MKSVISASRRTDIPAYYLNWFVEAVTAGYVEVVNPFYKKNKRIVRLDPDHVNWIVFWSRNYAHFIRQKDFFRDYNLFFHFTILPNSILERAALPIEKALHQMRLLSEIYGPGRIVWRYDPIVHWIENQTITSNHDLEKFEDLCKTIGSFGIKRCYFSFVTTYQKFEKRFVKKFPGFQIYNLDKNLQLSILYKMTDVSEKYNIKLYSCCNDGLLTDTRICKGHCIDGKLLNEMNKNEKISVAKTPTRDDCGCSHSIDIGDYLKQPCNYGCIYCYANPAGY